MKLVQRRVECAGAKAINPDPVFDLDLPLSQVADACRAMDKRRAIKAIFRP